MSKINASILFTGEEILAAAQAAATLVALLNKINTAAPDVWASVTADFNDAAAAWAHPAGITPAPAIAAPADVTAAVERSGQYAGMPLGITDVADAPPSLVNPVVETAAVSTVTPSQAEYEKATAAPGVAAPAGFPGADAVTAHVEAAAVSVSDAVASIAANL